MKRLEIPQPSLARRKAALLMPCSAASAKSWVTLPGPWAGRAFRKSSALSPAFVSGSFWLASSFSMLRQHFPDEGALWARSLSLNVLGNV